MYRCDDFEIWNLTEGLPVWNAAQSLFNVVGNVRDPASLDRFTYCLNGSAPRQVFTNQSNTRIGRLERPGDFNIDTIHSDELRHENTLVLQVERGGSIREYLLHFKRNDRVGLTDPNLKLQFDDLQHPAQIGQVVDGRWQVAKTPQGSVSLEIQPVDAGYDRVILFGSKDWTSGYEVRCLLETTQYTHRVHIFGLVFKWNPHPKGDGLHLPQQWNTGLAVYDSRHTALRLRSGANVQIDEEGNKQGDILLGETRLRRNRLIDKLLRRLIHERANGHPLPNEKIYQFILTVDRQCTALKVHPYGSVRPTYQVQVSEPPDQLSSGSVGVIAYHCGLKIHDFEVKPYTYPNGKVKK